MRLRLLEICAVKQISTFRALSNRLDEAAKEQRSDMEYRSVATTLEGFVQQLAVAYIAHGYYFYVSGLVPEGKDPEAIDRKLTAKYSVAMSKFARHRRKALGQASVQYLRFERFFILLATHGKHRFFWSQEEGGEGSEIRDVRRHPIKFGGYSISCRKRTGAGASLVAHVRIEQRTYLEIRDALVDLATKRTRPWLEYQFRNFFFEPYAPIRRQMVSIFRRVNRARSAAGLETLDQGCLPLRRKPVRPFEAVQVKEIRPNVPT